MILGLKAPTQCWADRYAFFLPDAHSSVIPAQGGIQRRLGLDSRRRGNDLLSSPGSSGGAPRYCGTGLRPKERWTYWFTLDAASYQRGTCWQSTMCESRETHGEACRTF